MRGIKGIVILWVIALVSATVSPAIAFSQDSTIYKPGPIRSVAPYSGPIGDCGPIDLAIVLDDTGSMGPAISNVILGLPSIVSTAITASGGDLNIGFVTFRDTVEVKEPLTPAPAGVATFTSLIGAEIATGGFDSPEPSDEAKNTVINNLGPAPRLDVKGISGTQIGDFNTAWRPGALKLAVLITDSNANGFGEGAFPSGDPAYDAHMASLGTDAAAKGIHFFDVFVPDIFSVPGAISPMTLDASNSGGAFLTTAPDGTGTADAINSIVATCGKPGIPEFPTVVLPVLGALGMMFLFLRRKQAI